MMVFKRKHVHLVLISLVFFLVVAQFGLVRFSTFKQFQSISLPLSVKSFATVPKTVTARKMITREKVFKNHEQNKLYAEFIANGKSSSQSSKYKIHNQIENNASNSNKSFFIIVEFTKIDGKKKYCDLYLNPSLIKDSRLFDELAKTNQKSVINGNEKNNNNNKFEILDKCEYTNCFFTCDKSFTQQSDVVLFHGTDLELEIKRENDFRTYYKKKLSFNRDPKQIWLLWNDDLNKIPQSFDQFNFNWTMSYSTESEISYATFGTYIMLNKILPDQEFSNRMRQEHKNRLSEAIHFLNDCNKKNNKMLSFMLELSNYFPIDIYDFKCNKTIINDPKTSFRKYLNLKSNQCDYGSSCENDAKLSHKFYLAFESQNCTDYVTENFWRALDYNQIPIVYQPSKQHYLRLAPNKSFIHASDFDFNANKLAAYLQKVSSNLSLYSSHMEWKKKFKPIYKKDELESLRSCEMCYLINKNQKNLLMRSYYKHVSEWMNDQCSN